MFRTYPGGGLKQHQGVFQDRTRKGFRTPPGGCVGQHHEKVHDGTIGLSRQGQEEVQDRALEEFQVGT